MNPNNIFLFFSIVLFISSLSVIVFKNPVYSVICLVLTFVASSGILILLECEFFSFLFLIIYVGAIAVLFLFVVMMLDVKIMFNISDFKYYIFSIFATFFFLTLVMPIIVSYFEGDSYKFININYNMHINWYCEDLLTEVESLGQILYTHYTLQFLVAGLILFLAVIGVVTLTINLSKRSFSTTVKQVSRVIGL